MASRRTFITQVAGATIGTGLTTLLPFKTAQARELIDLSAATSIEKRVDLQLYETLLMQWTDALMKLQITDKSFSGLYGGIMCPSCGRIHGRCGDAVLPFMWMAERTGQQKYLDAAKRVMQWSENNATTPDGAWVNDVNVNLWKGITAFGTIALAEAIKHHGHLLDNKTKYEWTGRLKKACDFLYGFITINTSNINYPLCSSYSLALGGEVLREQKFIDRATELAHGGLPYFTKNNFLYGEGSPRTASERGCYPVDVSYNVEESLPCLTYYALATNDETVLKQVITSWKAHLEFLLPDGGWDDSFGTRNHKWTYWGSRNSDGCQAGLLLLSDREPMFAEAAYRNALVLQKCTNNGILYGGPDYVVHGVQPCIHHSFAHAKSLATALNEKSARQIPFTRSSLPREKVYGLKSYAEIDTTLVSEGSWRATITGSDCQYKESPHVSGGSIALLWHEQMGLLLTDSLQGFKMREAANMQLINDPVELPLTPRLEMRLDDAIYSNHRYPNAIITSEKTATGVLVKVTTKFMDDKFAEPPGGSPAIFFNYLFSKNEVNIAVRMEGADKGSFSFMLPIVSTQNESCKKLNDGFEITKQTGKLSISSNEKIEVVETGMKRIFSASPGVEALPLAVNWDVKQNPLLSIKIIAG